MSGFVEKMRLKEMAEEDIYFAQRDRELIEAMHRKKAQRDEVDGEQDTANPMESNPHSKSES